HRENNNYFRIAAKTQEASKEEHLLKVSPKEDSAGGSPLPVGMRNGRAKSWAWLLNIGARGGK
ncbi:MAG: hypothetical protein ACKPKO_49760, partial [Candidatus Fonsibacter sp.]